MTSFKLQSLAAGVIYLAFALGAAIPAHNDIPALKEAIALKLNPTSIQTALNSRAVDGANLVEELVNKALQTGNKARRDSKFNVSPLFNSLSPEKITEMVQLATERDPTYEPVDFNSWYQVQFPDSIQSEEATAPAEILDLLKNLAGYDQVKSVQRLGAVVAPPAVEPNDDPLFKDQGYLKDTGINVQYAWGFPGGDGAGTTLIDIERGWHLEHEDLISANITLKSGNNVRAIRGFGFIRPHGTAVLGEIFMRDNTLGGVGAAPAAQGHVVGIQRDVDGGPQENQPAAIMDAISFLQPGDAMLLEMQAGDVNGTLYPVEILDAEFDAIRLAVAMGITVVEPAANGGADLDLPVRRFEDPEGVEPRAFLRRGGKDYRESGAIMVGAGSAGLPRRRLEFSNYGSRVDVFAWGESIVTTNVTEEDESVYTDSFVGTSGAAPIVAGAVLSIQGMVSANRGVKLSPGEMREVIVVGGSESSNPAEDRIGVQPNLRALIDGGFLN